MSTRSGRIRLSVRETSPVQTKKRVSPSRSPARSRKNSPRARKVSPAHPAKKSPNQRTPTRKSPSRKTPTNFSARKSPARAPKEVKPTAEVAPEVVRQSPSKRPALKSNLSIKLEDLTANFESLRNARNRRMDYTLRDVTSTNSQIIIESVNGVESKNYHNLRNRRSVEELPPRRSSRLRDFIDRFEHDTADGIHSMGRHSVTKSVSKSKSVDTFSDEERSEDESKSRPITRKLATPIRSSVSTLKQISSKWEFGGRLGSAILIFLIPITVFAILISCSNKCSTSIDVAKLKAFTPWFSYNSLAFIIAQILVQSVFLAVPVMGTIADGMDGTDRKYCFNGFSASLFTVNAVFLFDYLKVINKNILINEFIQLSMISYILAIFLSIILYLKSKGLQEKELNAYGKTGYILYDFFMGCEIHPHIKGLNMKILISRISNITSLILTLIIFSRGLQLQLDKNDTLTLENYKEILNKLHFQPTILIFSLMQIIYVLSFILREYKITSTFYWQSEGLGYLQIVSSALYPYYFTSISKYVADNNVMLSTNALIFACLLFTLGFFVMLVSNNIKHEFRTNPLQPSLANVDSMPTFHGKKLLVSNMWGFLRHPNYTGDILIHIALSLPGLLSGRYIASAPAFLTILILLHRSWRDHDRCKRRYGAAWQRYCNRVPSVVIPKIL